MYNITDVRALHVTMLCQTLTLILFVCCSYIKGLLGGPTPAEYEALKQEKEDLQQQLGTVKQQLEEMQAKVHCPKCVK